jgi:hypothetical protein
MAKLLIDDVQLCAISMAVVGETAAFQGLASAAAISA